MTFGKIRRSERYKQTQPPRLVHAVQRVHQPCVTVIVTQITETSTFSSALDISPLHSTSTAIRAVAAARRLQEPDRRTRGKAGATSDALAVQPPRVTPSRSPRSVPGGAGGTARGSGGGVPPRDPGGCASRRGAGGIDRDGTVTPAIPRPASPPWGRRTTPGRGPARRTSSAPRVRSRIVHQFQLRIAHSFRSIASPFGESGRSGHQFQLRMARSSPVVEL